MSIIGNGVDIVENNRIAKSIKNSSFINRIFTKKEVDQLWVIGPRASFTAWKTEFTFLTNREVKSNILVYHGVLYSIRLYHIILCYVILCYIILYSIILYDIVLCYIKV